ncbi:hypothetical protein [Streptosporangium sp. NPDC049644]|uniref:hypothetical protein n=1 Tax=Streptosporangium sp. NPDC049644 TaxID=3155507 RepID=UPI0034300DE0
MRRWLKITLTVMIVMGVVACTPPVKGATGFSVDTEGHPIIVLAWCDGATPDGVIIYHDEPYSSAPAASTTGRRSATPSIEPSTRIVDDARFIASDLDGQSASVRLDAPADGWRADPGPVVLKPGITYTAFGFQGRGNSQVNTGHVSFRAADLAKLKPGQVLVQQGESVPLKTPDVNGVDSEIVFADKVISRERFDREGQDPTYC